LESVLPGSHRNYDAQRKNSQRIATGDNGWSHLANLVADRGVEVHKPTSPLDIVNGWLLTIQNGPFAQFAAGIV
jgi:hypothetical protein